MIAIVIGSVVAIGAVIMAYAHWVEPFSPRVSRTRVEILKPNSRFAGFKVLHLSDFHLRDNTNPRIIEAIDRAAKELGRENIDLICITGDMIETDTGLPLLEEVMRILARIGPRNGILAILGNHDYNHYPLSNLFLEKYIVNQKNDTPQLIAALSRSGTRVLRNQKHIIERGDERLVVIGIDDFISGRHCIQSSFEGVLASDTVLLLTHSPDVVSHILDRKVDLVLAGHTHGGQMRLPLVGAFVSRSRVFRRFSAGLFNAGDMSIFITKGLGMVRYAPFRFRCAPELAVLELGPRAKAEQKEAA